MCGNSKCELIPQGFSHVCEEGGEGGVLPDEAETWLA